MIFATNPKTRDMLLALADRWELKQAKADDAGKYIMAQILERGLQRGDARLAALIEETMGRSIAPRPRPPVRAAPIGLRRESRWSVAAPITDRRSIKPVLSEAEGTSRRITHRPTREKKTLTRRSTKIHQRTSPI